MDRRITYVLFFLLPLLTAAGPAAESSRPATRPNGLSRKSIAVVAGTTTDINVFAAQFITDALEKKSLLSVLAQDKIAHLLPKYPATIRGPYTANYVTGFKEDYSKTDIAKIRAIQEKLGVEYLYVIWAATSERSARGTVTSNFIAQLFHSPRSSDIEHGTFDSVATGKRSLVFFNTCLSIVSLKFNDPTNEEELEELKLTCNETAGHIMAIVQADR